MARQIWSLPDLMAGQYQDLEPKVRQLLGTPEIYSLRRLTLTGCGDSFAACLAARSAFEQLTEIPVEVVPTVELSRHSALPGPGSVPNLPFLIAVSHSGQVARVFEAVKRVNAHGGLTVGITGNSASLLGQEADKILELDIPGFESGPGVRSYLVSLLSLLLLAIRMGEVLGRMTMDEANLHRRELLQLPARLKQSLPEMDREMFAVAQEWQDLPAFDFAGAGPDYASAFYGQAKMFEATGRYAMLANTEEWLHLNFFVRDVENTGTVLIVDKHSASLSRAWEVAEHMARLGRPLLILTTANKEIFSGQAHVLRFPETCCSWMSPVASFVPLALLSGYIAALVGEEYGRGARDNWRACKNGGTVKNSQIMIIEEGRHA